AAASAGATASARAAHAGRTSRLAGPGRTAAHTRGCSTERAAVVGAWSVTNLLVADAVCSRTAVRVHVAGARSATVAGVSRTRAGAASTVRHIARAGARLLA